MPKRVTAPKHPTEAALDALDSATTILQLRAAVKVALRTMLDERRGVAARSSPGTPSLAPTSSGGRTR